MYQSYRRVDIASRSLAMLYYGTLLAAVLLVLAMVFVNHGHLSFTEPKITRFLRTEEPEGFHELAQCPQGLQADGTAGTAVRCTVWDWLQIVEASRDEVFVTTFVEEVLEKRVCSRFRAECKGTPIWTVVNRTEFYTASPELMLLRVEHEVVGMSPQFGGTGAMKGLLFPTTTPAVAGGVPAGRGAASSCSGIVQPSQCHEFAAAGQYAENGAAQLLQSGTDNFSLDTLLAAAGAPTLRESDVHDPPFETVRRRGLHLEATVYYSNLWKLGDWWSWFMPVNPARYVYCIDSVRHKDDSHDSVAKGQQKSESKGQQKSEFSGASRQQRKGCKIISTLGEESSFLRRQDSPLVSEDDETRVVRTQYGIHFHFRSDGKFASVSLSAAIGFMAGALSLLGLPWTLTELYLSVLPLFKRKLPQWYHGALLLRAAEAQQNKSEGQEEKDRKTKIQ